MTLLSVKLELVLVFSVLTFINCEAGFERKTRVKLEGGSTPTFVLSGSGTLGNLLIYGPKQRDVGTDRSFALWEIEPKAGFLHGELLEKIRRIKYGVVPEGYRQVYPENNGVPPTLSTGERYEYWFQTVNGSHARSYFEIRDGQAVESQNQ
ncbi:MAG TPA: hypothetical protein VGQ39_20880 [Pyrinomonadaceae bacterium]|jgi:hypothetical protein|nr:hypothetical protein [Pyrinomonadaceae bacterium]